MLMAVLRFCPDDGANAAVGKFGLECLSLADVSDRCDRPAIEQGDGVAHIQDTLRRLEFDAALHKLESGFLFGYEAGALLPYLHEAASEPDLLLCRMFCKLFDDGCAQHVDMVCFALVGAFDGLLYAHDNLRDPMLLTPVDLQHRLE